MCVDRAYSQHVVVIPGRADHHSRRIPRRFGVLSRALPGSGVAGCDHHDDVLDVHRVGQRCAECAVVERRPGADAGNRGDIDHRSAEVRGGPYGSCHGVDITESGGGRIRYGAELGAGLADGDQTDARGYPAEAVAMIGIRCGGDNPGHGRSMPVAILGAVTGEHIVTAGRSVRKSRVRRNPGVDDSDPLARTTGEFPNLWQVKSRQLARCVRTVCIGTYRWHCADLPLYGGLRRPCPRRLR